MKAIHNSVRAKNLSPSAQGTIAGFSRAKLQRILIFCMATENMAAYLERYVQPQLVNEYQNDYEDFLALLPKVPAEAVGKEGIYKNRLVGFPEVVIDNVDDFDAPAANDKRNLFTPWHTVDSAPTKTTRSEVRGLTYDLGSELRKRHMAAIKRATRDYLLWVLAPQSHTANTPVIELADGLNWQETIKMRKRITDLNIDMRDTMLILSSDHVLDLGKEQGAGNRFREVMFNEVEGKAKAFAGFPNVFEFNNMPQYNPSTGAKLAFGATNGVPCSLVVNIPEVVFHREDLKIYYKPASEDTRSADPSDEFRLGGYMAADKQVNKGFAAMFGVSDNS